MLNNGDHELVARVLQWAESHCPEEPTLTALKQQTFRKLKERYQESNPFKCIVYSEMIADETGALPQDRP